MICLTISLLLILNACSVTCIPFDTSVDVVIVGSGLSGLSTAFELSKNGLSVLILESNAHTGGRTRSVDNVSVGGTYVPPNNNNLLSLADEIGIPPVSNSNCIRTVPESLFLDASLGEYLYLIMDDVIKASQDQSDVFSHPKAIELDKYTLVEWMQLEPQTNFSEEAKRSFVEYFVTSETILEDQHDSLSALHAGMLLWARLSPVPPEWILKIGWRTIKDLDVNLLSSAMKSDFMKRLPQLIFGRTLFPYMFSMWWEGGTGVFTQKLVEATIAKGAQIRTSQLVEKIHQDQDHVYVTTRQGTTVQARYTVLAVGPLAAAQIEIENRFDNKDSVVGYGAPFAGLNILLFYDSCWWKGGAYGFLADSKDADAILGPAPVLPTTCVPGENALRTLSNPFISTNYTDQELIEKAVEYITRHYPEKNDTVTNYKRGMVFNWYEKNPQITAGFAYKPGYLTKYGKHFLKAHHRVYISGSERSIKGMNWMEGAVTSGLTVARNIVNSL